jgi:hypothetical protein
MSRSRGPAGRKPPTIKKKTKDDKYNAIQLTGGKQTFLKLCITNSVKSVIINCIESGDDNISGKI